MTPYFVSYTYKNSDYNLNNGLINDIVLTGDSLTYTVNWYNQSGLIAGPFTGSLIGPPSTSLSNLEPGSYTGVVTDNIAQTSTTVVNIEEKNELSLSATVTDNSCLTTFGCDCEITVHDFVHNVSCFKYDLYHNDSIVETYTGCSGNEQHVFTGICPSGIYKIVAYETEEVYYEYRNNLVCETTTVVIGETTDPVSLVNDWNRFCLNGLASFRDSSSQTNVTGLLPTGEILTDNPLAYYYTGATNTNYLGSFALPMNEGDNVGPITTGIIDKFYFNSIINKFVIGTYATGFAPDRWTTFNPTVNYGVNGNPTATSALTSNSQWTTEDLTSNQYTVSGNNNTVVLASTKISEAGGITKMIECTNNSALYNGFISPCGYVNYIHEITLGSTYSDDDTIGVILCWFRDDNGDYGPPGVSHNISVSFTNQGNSSAQVMYNVGNSAYAFNDGGTGLTSYNGVIVKREINPFSVGEYSLQGSIRVRITRSGSYGQDFKIEMTDTMGDKSGTQYLATKNVGESNLYNPLYTIQFSLGDKSTWEDKPSFAIGNELEKFYGSQQYGYLTLSQPETQFYDLSFVGNQTNVYPTIQTLIPETEVESIFEFSTTISGSCVSEYPVCSTTFVSDSSPLYIDFLDSDNSQTNYFEITPSIICDPCPSAETTCCGCNIETVDSSIRIEIRKKQEKQFDINDCGFGAVPPEEIKIGDDYGYVQFTLLDNKTKTKFVNKPECCVYLGYTPNYIPDGNGGYYTTCVWGNGGYSNFSGTDDII